MSLQERVAQLRTAAEQAAAGDSRATVETALARTLVQLGDYAEALVQIGAARRDATNPTVHDQLDYLTGLALLRRGDDERAEPPLDRHMAAAAHRHDIASQARAHVLLGDIYRRRGDSERALAALGKARSWLADHPEDDLLARMACVNARLALDADDLVGAIREAEQALELAADPDHAAARSEAYVVLAEALLRNRDFPGSERACRDAFTAASAAGLKRELAEAYVAYAHVIGESGGTLDGLADEKPASWLARALELFRDHGSLADLERVRESFRRFGRRATDRVHVNEVKLVMDELRTARLTVAREAYRLVDLVKVSMSKVEVDVGEPVREVFRVLEANASRTEQTIEATVDAMSAAEGRVLTATHAVISERERIRTLLDLSRMLNSITESTKLVSQICRMAAQLTGADRALVALISDHDKLDVRAAHHFPSLGAETGWRTALDTLARGGGPLLIDEGIGSKRGQELRLGSAVASPLRHGDTLLGAVYADKELSGGMFTLQELDLLAIFCAQAATTLSNVRAAETIRLEGRARAVTLEAISDGVLSLDRSGAVRAINAVAARILGVSATAALTLNNFPDLSFLRTALERGEPVESRVSRIGPAEHLVNARVVRGDDGEVAALVVTFAEMKRVQTLAQRIAGSPARYSFGDIIGRSPLLRRKLQLAEAAARSDSSVLITGESGTGKEVLAQAIHNASARASGPFVGINCSAIPRELIESELFGYEGGAFTGARKGGNVGKFELADGGTLLLDEIGDMPIEMQAKLLRVLQERRVLRLGGNREVSLDVRVIASTNRDLEETVHKGHFRADLLFRLKVIHILLPPLRERTGDMPLLVEHYLALFAARLGKKVKTLAPDVMAAFTNYSWPGNIRELENILEGEVNLATPDQLVLDQIPDTLYERASARNLPQRLSPAGDMTIDDAERELLVQALERHRGSIPDVARTLGVSRGTVYNKIRRHALDPDQFRKQS